MYKNIVKFGLRIGCRYYCCKPAVTPNCCILGKNVLITGAANGIGLATTKLLLKLGANKVCMLDCDEKNGKCASKALNAEYKRDCTCFQKVDVTGHDEFEEAFQNCKNWVKKLDIVYNNAGVLDDHNWLQCVNVNQIAVIRGMMFAFDYMGWDQGGCGGTVINSSSALGLQAFAGCPVYVGTSAAVIGMTRSWGTQFWYDHTGIRVLAICPGVTDTNMITAIRGTDDDPLTQELKKGLDAVPSQPADKVAEAFVTMVTRGENGSVWIAEACEPVYEVKIPERSSLKHKS